MTPEVWEWQGFFGPMSVAAAAKAVVDGDARAGVRVPLAGDPPVPVDETGTTGMFAVQTRTTAKIPVPAGLSPARSDIVGRLVNA